MKFNHPSGHKETEEDYFSGEASEAEEADGSENEAAQEADDESQSKRREKIRTVVRKPQPKLDPARLLGARGLKSLMEIFQNFKQKGDGLEFKDLESMMAKYEYWAHRLFPKMKFSDVIERLEKLGEKREVKRHLYDIRLGLTESVGDNDEHDLALQDEETTATVMNMITNINESDEENIQTANVNNEIDDDDDDNELISQLLI
ncbi:TIMELESS-interacting, partial [Brachionus plicatilis]